MKKIFKLLLKKENLNTFFCSLLASIMIIFLFFNIFYEKNIFFLFGLFIIIYIVENLIKKFQIKYKGKVFKYYIFFAIILLFLAILYFLSIFIILKNFDINIVKFNFFIFLSILFIFLFYLTRYIILITVQNPIIFYNFLIIFSFILFLIRENILLNGIYLIILFFFGSIYYLLFNSEKKLKIIIKIFFILFVLFLSFYFAYVKSSTIETKGSSSLLKEENFKYSFKDYLDLSSRYSYSNKLLFIIKTDNLNFLKTITFSEYSVEKGFFSEERELPYPEILSDYYWEDRNYIIGNEYRINDEIIVFNINLKKYVVFGKNETYRIVPLISENSIFSNIFKSNSFILFGDVDLNISFEKLSKFDLEKYTKIILNDKDIINFIEKEKKDNKLNSKKDIIIHFYNLFKKEYKYSLNSKGEGFESVKNFLLFTKKGYCSHFAYAYAMILRYFGIPCRVVGGFSFSKKNLLFDKYYKIFDYNAHAWVEVWTDKYGWIEINPTSDILAEDEILPFSSEIKENEYKYLENIIKIFNDLKEVDKKYSKKDIKKDNSKIINLDQYKKLIRKYYLKIILFFIFFIIFWFFARFIILYIFMNNKYFSKKFAKILFNNLKKIITLFIKTKIIKSNIELKKYKILSFEDLYNFLKIENLKDLKHKKKEKYFINLNLLNNEKYKNEIDKKFNINFLREDYYKLFFKKNKSKKIRLISFIEFIKIYYYFYFAFLLF